MSSEAEPSLSVNALTTTAAAETLVTAPLPPTVLSLDDLGPAVCPTCGSLQIDAMDPLRAISGVLLSLLASLLGLVGLFSLLAGFIARGTDAPILLLLGSVTSALSAFAGYCAHRVARRTARHQTVCRICGETAGRWTSTASDSGSVLATMFAGPLMLPGLSLVAIAVASVGTVSPRATLGLVGIGGGLVVLALMIVRRPWTASRGTDWASGNTLGRFFLGGQGVGTNPVLRRLQPTEPPAKGLLSPSETALADDLAALVVRGVIVLESRDDIVWSRFLSYHRLTIVPAALHAAWEPTSTLHADESAFVERVVSELRAAGRFEAGDGGNDYRTEEATAPGASAEPVRLPLLELLARVGVETASAHAVEGALRSTVRPRKLGSRAYARLRQKDQRTLVVRKGGLRHRRGGVVRGCRGRRSSVGPPKPGRRWSPERACPSRRRVWR